MHRSNVFLNNTPVVRILEGTQPPSSNKPQTKSRPGRERPDRHPLDETLLDCDVRRSAVTIYQQKGRVIRVPDCPPEFGDVPDRLQKNAWAQLASPLSELVLTELRWYFERRTGGLAGLGEPADRRRFERCERAFATDRYTVLYRCWRQDGERVLATASSPVVGKAMESGAGKIEPLVLPHAYSHLAPMAGVA